MIWWKVARWYFTDGRTVKELIPYMDEDGKEMDFWKPLGNCDYFQDSFDTEQEAIEFMGGLV